MQGVLSGVSFTRQALRAGARLIVAVGDDRTLNQVVNGFFLDGQALYPEAVVALIPAEGSSDVARGLGIPDGLSALELLTHGRPLNIDVGVASFNGGPGQPDVRHFVNTADLGIGARLAGAGRDLDWAGAWARPLRAGASALALPRPWRGSLSVDSGQPTGLMALSVAIALGPYAWGGVRIAPRAKMDDGLMDVVTIGAMKRSELLGALSKGDIARNPSQDRVRETRARTVRVAPDGRVPIQIDGEVVGEGAVDVRILPGAIKIMVPLP
jgi:diacylglycerol kinase family enzyme